MLHMPRSTYDFTHQLHSAGHIGRLQTLSVIPVVAGESLEFDIAGIVRLSPTRQYFVAECQVEFWGFHVPHRHVYGEDWREFIQKGVDEGAAVTFTGVPIDADSRVAPYLRANVTGSELPLWLVYGYNFIFQRYFAVPNTERNGADGQADFTELDYFPNGTDQEAEHHRLYGKLMARPNHILNGGTPYSGGLTAAGYDLDLDTGVGGDTEVTAGATFDIRTLAEVKSRYKSEVETTYFSAFYSDLMPRRWGTNVTTDADQRPELLFHETRMLSGKDVNGTADGNLGDIIGKGMDWVNFQMPRKAFNEHGAVWIMCAFRYPLVHCDEIHPLMKTVDPDYDLISGDPDRYASLAPIPFDPHSWLCQGNPYTPTLDIREAYGQHYRWQPNQVHPIFREVEGFPFTKADNNDDPYRFYYYQDLEYQDTFQETHVAQWQCHLLAEGTKYTPIPAPLASAFMSGEM